MGHGTLVYIGRLSCTKFSTEFSCVKPIQGYFSVQTLRTLNHNIRTWSTFLETIQHRILSSLTLLSSSTKGQHCSLVKKNSWALGLRGILVRQKKPSHLLASKPTVAHQTYYLMWTCLVNTSCISLVLQISLWSVYCYEMLEY